MNLVAAGFLLQTWDFEYSAQNMVGIRYTFAFLDCCLSFLPGGKKTKQKKRLGFGQFRGAHGKGSGVTEDQSYLGPLHTR